jgi:hypothetical protein
VFPPSVKGDLVSCQCKRTISTPPCRVSEYTIEGIQSALTSVQTNNEVVNPTGLRFQLHIRHLLKASPTAQAMAEPKPDY